VHHIEAAWLGDARAKPIFVFLLPVLCLPLLHVAAITAKHKVQLCRTE